MTSSKNPNSQPHSPRFGRFADKYVASKSHAQGAELDRLLEIGQPQSDWIMLDIATGCGHTALKFAPFVRGVTAADISEKMLTAARKLILQSGAENVAFVSLNAEVMPFKDEMFDLLTCRIAAHHFADCPAFLRESRRVLKPGRFLLLQDLTVPEDTQSANYVEKFEKLRDPSHCRAFSKSRWANMFEEAGLQVATTEIIAKRHDFIAWVQRQGGTPDTVRRLSRLMANAAPGVLEWMQPLDFGTPQASFANRHVIIAGQKIG